MACDAYSDAARMVCELNHLKRIKGSPTKRTGFTYTRARRPSDATRTGVYHSHGTQKAFWDPVLIRNNVLYPSQKLVSCVQQKIVLVDVIDSNRSENYNLWGVNIYLLQISRDLF